MSNFPALQLSSKRLQNPESYRRSQHLFLQEEITFKTIERKKVIRELKKIKNDLRTIMNFIGLTHISSKFTVITLKQLNG